MWLHLILTSCRNTSHQQRHDLLKPLETGSWVSLCLCTGSFSCHLCIKNPLMCSKHHKSAGESGAVNISSGLFLDQCFQSPAEGPISWFIHTQNSGHVGGDVTVMWGSSLSRPERRSELKSEPSLLIFLCTITSWGLQCKERSLCWSISSETASVKTTNCSWSTAPHY